MKVLNVSPKEKLCLNVFHHSVTGLEMNYTNFAEKYFIEKTKHCPGGEKCDRRLTCVRMQKNKVSEPINF